MEELYWVNIEDGQLLRTGQQDDVLALCVPGPLGSATPTVGGGGWALGVRNGVLLVDEAGEERAFIEVDAERPDHRMNDAACDPGGCLWTGTLGGGLAARSDAVYRISPDLGVTLAISGVGLSNGIGWSPDGLWMYHADSHERAVFRYEFDPGASRIGRSSRFIDFSDRVGVPDGLAVDTDGGIWIAVWDGWGVRRYSPNGSLDFNLPLPVARPTSCAFGGTAMTSLFITTARSGLSAADLRAQPIAGHVLELPTEFTGVAMSAFGI